MAQIFSRYYQHDIQMHGYQNGNSLKVKRDNWAQLLRFFQKRSVRPGGKDVTEAEVEDIVQCQPGVAIDFVHRCYELLTGKRVRRTAAALVEDDTPAYAMPTAARIVYEKSREPSIELTSDLGTKASIMQEALEEHKRTLRKQVRVLALSVGHDMRHGLTYSLVGWFIIIMAGSVRTTLRGSSPSLCERSEQRAKPWSRQSRDRSLRTTARRAQSRSGRFACETWTRLIRPLQAAEARAVVAVWRACGPSESCVLIRCRGLELEVLAVVVVVSWVGAAANCLQEVMALAEGASDAPTVSSIAHRTLQEQQHRQQQQQLGLVYALV